MYHRYESQCFVLSSSPENEASRTYSIFSKDLGLIYAKAQGVALSKSKLRGSLEAPSQANLSLIKGKEIWRIVGAEYGTNLWRTFENNREGLLIFVRLGNLIKRMVAGEERHEALYKVLEDCHLALSAKNRKEDLFALELVSVSSLLHHLGYFKLKEEYTQIFNVPFMDLDSNVVIAKKHHLISDINQALKESHL